MTVKHRRNDDGSHLVEIHALKVLLLQEGRHWIAQGLDLDYAAAGESIADAKQRFSEGLLQTICAHIKKNESLEALIRPAPREYWQLYYRTQRTLETSVQELPDSHSELAGVFKKLAFLQPTAA